MKHIRDERVPWGARRSGTPRRCVPRSRTFGGRSALLVFLGPCRSQRCGRDASPPLSRVAVCAGARPRVFRLSTRAQERRTLQPTDFVALPVLPVRAATPGENAEEVADLEPLKPEAIWAAPAEFRNRIVWVLLVPFTKEMLGFDPSNRNPNINRGVSSLLCTRTA
jgi:hypothetical protein